MVLGGGGGGGGETEMFLSNIPVLIKCLLNLLHNITSEFLHEQRTYEK